MKIIKIDTINSTNDFLKKISQENFTENFTIVVANQQTQGRGQMGTNWHSEKGMNLTFSVLVKEVLIDKSAIFMLNKAVSLAVLKTLSYYKIPCLSIKWPNDILSENKKLVGILIENIFKSNDEIHSIIGIGINVNQNLFLHLPNASSMSIIKAKTFDLDDILKHFIKDLEIYINLIKFNKLDEIKSLYDKYLYHKDKLSVFEDLSNQRFMGIIRQVNDDGKLIIEKENNVFESFEFKQIITLLNYKVS